MCHLLLSIPLVPCFDIIRTDNTNVPLLFEIIGYPFGSMDYYVDDCQNSGTPLMLLSHLQINMHNIKSNNKASLAVRRYTSLVLCFFHIVSLPCMV